MALLIEIGNGKTRMFNDVIEYLEFTERDGFQSLWAEDTGTYLDSTAIKVVTGGKEDFELPEDLEEWNPSK